jgi:hypothetical protein
VPAAAWGLVVGGQGAVILVHNLQNPPILYAKRNNEGGKIPAIQPPSDSERSGLRRAMQKAGIKPPAGMVNPQAHHNLPWVFKDWFAGEGRGLNVNDVQFGRWVSGNPPGFHQTWTAEYEREWFRFITSNPNATRQDVLNFLNQMLSSGRFP